MPQPQPVFAEGAPGAVGPYVHAMRAAGLLFCSGQTPLDPATGELVDGPIGAQAARCLQNLQIVCEAAGTSLRTQAVRCAIYVTDMSSFGEVNEAYGAFFGDRTPPARTTIGVSELPLGAKVEVDAVVLID